jgi:hypothetical protein
MIFIRRELKLVTIIDISRLKFIIIMTFLLTLQQEKCFFSPEFRKRIGNNKR